MPIAAHGYAALRSAAPLQPFAFERREPGQHDIVLAVRYCGVCHTDLNAIANVRGHQQYPLVPGHEIVGTVVAAGSAVSKFEPGDWAAIGTIIDSCRNCEPCRQGLEPYCSNGMTGTYGSVDRHGMMAYGGYANNYVVDEHFAHRLPPELDPASSAPLLCAGITTYSPMRRAGVGLGDRVGIIGLGGLGHVAVKLARAMGAKVSVFSTSPKKENDALRLGADELIILTDHEAFARNAGAFDFILDTVSGDHDVDPFLGLLRFEGIFCLVGMPVTQIPISPVLLARGRRIVTGSMIGGLPETEEMLAFCAQHGVVADIELIRMADINGALKRLEQGDVRYRFVIDMASLGLASSAAPT